MRRELRGDLGFAVVGVTVATVAASIEVAAEIQAVAGGLRGRRSLTDEFLVWTAWLGFDDTSIWRFSLFGSDETCPLLCSP